MKIGKISKHEEILKTSDLHPGDRGLGVGVHIAAELLLCSEAGHNHAPAHNKITHFL